MKYPFTPDVLDALPEEIAALFRQLEDDLLEEICSRLKIADNLNEVTVQDIRALRGMGIDLEEVKKLIADRSKTSIDRLNTLFDEVVARNQVYFTELIDLAKVTQPEHIVSDKDIAAIASQTKGELTNITQSMGFLVRKGGKTVLLPPAKVYQHALDRAEMQIMSGGISYGEAVKTAVKELAGSGLKRVDYESGHTDHVDVAVRRAVMTGINQLCDKYTEQSAEFLETKDYEVSAHIGARDTGTGWQNHKSWQGKVYSEGQGQRYPDIYEVCGLGYVDGLHGANCRHKRFPWVEGVSERTYTDHQLEHIDDGHDCEYQGKHYTAYEATQQQRKIERTVRKLSRLETAYKSVGLTEDAQDVSTRIRRLKSEYKEFSKAARLPEQAERMKIQYATDILDTPKFKELKKYNGHISVLGKFSDKQYVLDVEKPKISGSTIHYQENLAGKPDRKSLTPDVAQSIIDSSKLALYHTDRKTIKFLSEYGYVAINTGKEIVTAVPEKLRKKYRDYLEGLKNGQESK